MSLRLLAYGLTLAAIDLGWAIFLAVLVHTGGASGWLAWIVPLPFAAGAYIGIDVIRRFRQERA